MARMNRLLTTGLAGLVGCLIGGYYERYRLVQKDAFFTSYATTSSLSAETGRQPVVSIPYPNEKQLPTVQDSNRMITIMQHGFPSLDGLRNFRNFLLSYDRRTRNANWVFEHLSPEQLPHYQNSGDRPDRNNMEFFEDTAIHQYFRSTNADYKSSGYDRGHLAAAGNHKLSKEDLNQTFILSNISPQIGIGFNRGIWNKLERYVRYRAKGSKNLWVCTGPLYLPQKGQDGRSYVIYEVIGTQNVAVPTHFYKVLLVENKNGEFDLECYMIQNKAVDDNLPLQAFQVPLDSIERASGLILFEKFPRHRLKSINGGNKFLLKFDQSRKSLV